MQHPSTLSAPARVLAGACALLLLLCAVPTAAQTSAFAGGEEGKCSACVSTSSCEPGPYGGNGCSFSTGICNETGGNCNPTEAMLMNLELKPLAIVNIQTENGILSVAQLDNHHFATWSCADHGYVVFQKQANGSFTRIELTADTRQFAYAPYLAARGASLD
jgi:hypothetical protein